MAEGHDSNLKSHPREQMRVFGVDLRKIYPLPRDEAFNDLLAALDRIPSTSAKD